MTPRWAESTVASRRICPVRRGMLVACRAGPRSQRHAGCARVDGPRRDRPDACASARTIRSIASSTCRRTCGSKVRTLSRSSARSGMTLSLRAGLQRADRDDRGCRSAATSRDTIVCSRSTVAAAITTGSTVDSGIEPCAAAAEHRTRSAVGGARTPAPAGSPSTPAGQRHDVLAEHDVGLGEARRTGRRRSSPARPGRSPPPAGRPPARCRATHRGPPASSGAAPSQPGHVHVVTAGVHDRHVAPSGSVRRRGAGVRQAGRLRAPAARPCPPAASPSGPPLRSTPTTPVPPTPSVRLEPGLAQPGRADPGRTGLGERELRVAVQVAVQVGERGHGTTLVAEPDQPDRRHPARGPSGRHRSGAQRSWSGGRSTRFSSGGP